MDNNLRNLYIRYGKGTVSLGTLTAGLKSLVKEHG
jgi:hypothetical protein